MDGGAGPEPQRDPAAGPGGLLAEAGAAPADLSGVVACVGPGGFTALRIGVATAEGLALTGLPTWGFSAFELQGREPCARPVIPGPVWIILDGQRQEAFLQRWDDGPRDAGPEAPPGRAGRSGWGTAPGGRPNPSGRGSSHLPRPALALAAEAEATLAGLAALCRERPLGPAESPLVPFYLRETDAEVNFPEASAHLSEALRRGVAR